MIVDFLADGLFKVAAEQGEGCRGAEGDGEGLARYEVPSRSILIEGEIVFDVAQCAQNHVGFFQGKIEFHGVTD